MAFESFEQIVQVCQEKSVSFCRGRNWGRHERPARNTGSHAGENAIYLEQHA